MEELDEPSGYTCSPLVAYKARSSCSAAIKDEDMMATRSSKSPAMGCPSLTLSNVSMRDGRTLCRNMGSSGGVREARGVARTKTARRLAASAAASVLMIRLSSDQNVWRNSVAGVSARQAATLRNGGFPD